MNTPPSNSLPPTSPSVRGSLDQRASASELAAILAQLLLILAVVHGYGIEERRGLFAVLVLAVTGFVVHSWLAREHRRAFFLFLSLASLGLVLPWLDALAVCGIGLALVVTCRLPISPLLRITLLLLVAGNLAVWRAGSSGLFWPVLASMFMFRLILYVFETRGSDRPGWTETLAYFFQLPGACFALYPVVDLAAFRHTWYQRGEAAIYQTGVHWICRGITHLLLYRWIKVYLLPTPDEIQTAADLALFLAANYALYLHVSGQFHLITGVLHLFGYDLPRTHHWFFLATSFTDIWRRINIYWKDFMVKVFFLPAFFRLRRLGLPASMVLATLWVFIATWLLHSYQTFWLLGEFPLTLNDVLLWLSVGMLVAVNALVDYRRARQAPAQEPSWSWTRAAVTSLQALGMFALVSLFWARWTHPELLASTILGMMRSSHWGESLRWLVVALAAAMVLGVLLQWLLRQAEKWPLSARTSTFGTMAMANVGLLLLLLAAGQTGVYQQHTPALAGVVSTLKQDSVTPLEASQLVRGYYEEISEGTLQSQAFLDSRAARQPNRHVAYVDMTRPTGDMLQLELIPGWRGEIEGTPLSINRWGMRDGELPKRKPDGTYRVALLGSSVIMGYGVRDNEVFDAILEERLNSAQSPGEKRIELLNFGTGRSFAIHRRLLLEQKALEFEPDAVYYFAHQDEFQGPGPHLAEIWYYKFNISDPCLERVIQKAGLKPDTSWGLAHGALDGQAEEIVRCSYQRIVNDCRGRRILPVWIYLPMPGFADSPEHAARLATLAERAGFTVLNLSEWAKGYALEHIKLSAGDAHANAAGHRLIAQWLWEAIEQRPELLPAFKPAKQESDAP